MTVPVAELEGKEKERHLFLVFLILHVLIVSIIYLLRVLLSFSFTLPCIIYFHVNTACADNKKELYTMIPEIVFVFSF